MVEINSHIYVKLKTEFTTWKCSNKTTFAAKMEIYY